MRDIAVISFAQTPARRRVEELNEVEMLMPAIHGALTQVDMTIDDIGFTCSGSTDYLAGTAFSFVSTLDGVGPWPPIQESHVEMDGAWALYEAWVKLQLGEIDTALVYCYAKSSPGDLPMVLTRQLDPITVGPLWADAVSLAALQARALIDAGKATEADFAAVAARSRKDALANPRSSSRPTTTSPRCAGATARPSPTVQPRSCSPLATWPARRSSGRRGSGGSTTASSPSTSACATSP
jgi:acetyl-CoA acetyltransferase